MQSTPKHHRASRTPRQKHYGVGMDFIRILHHLHIFKRDSVTAVQYPDEVLKPIVRLYAAALGPTSVLMDDKTRSHRAAIVNDFLESERIAHMVWPPYSPDLNPIENFWDVLGRVASSHFPPPATLIELKTAL